MGPTVRYVVADVRDALAALPDGSADLVLTSPPFLALRSYLPSDHPDKHREIGSEPTPAAFLDTLLGLSAEWRRVLAPHGTLAVELGDTYSGSGGGGGDALPGGPRAAHGAYTSADEAAARGYDPEAEVAKASNAAHWRQKNAQRSAWPLDKSLSLIPEAYRMGLAYGRNPLTGTESPAGQWRVRNVVRWVRPNPPVGALGDKFRPATSDLVIACTSRTRWFDLDAVRTPNDRVDEAPKLTERHAFDGRVSGGDNGAVGKTVVQNPAGAPPLDWWSIPPGGYRGSHYAVFPPELCRRPIEAMCPRRVCRTCGAPSRRITQHMGESEYIDPPSKAQFSAALSVALSRAGLTHYEVAERLGVHETLIRHYLGKSGKENHRIPSQAMWSRLSDLLPFDAAIRARMEIRPPVYETEDHGRRDDPHRLDARIPNGAPPKRVATGWSTCGCPGTDGVRLDGWHTGTGWRPGLVLDPFGGSGTTLLVAHSLGRSSLGIDLDPRNLHLARERIGMWLEEETLTSLKAAS